jgi:hypothetical protein
MKILKYKQKKLDEKLFRQFFLEEQKERKQLKELQLSIPPKKLFINEIDKYSKFDENVICLFLILNIKIFKLIIFKGIYIIGR